MMVASLAIALIAGALLGRRVARRRGSHRPRALELVIEPRRWCRGAAVLLVRALTRALHQANEDAAMAQEREKFYRSAYATAVDELEHVCDMVETPQRSREEWRRHIEQLVRVETEEARAGRGVQHAEAMMKLGMVPR